MGESELEASVVICTRDRAASLAATLESIVVAAAVVDAPWELIVVDNGSRDATIATVDRFADRLPIRSVSEPVAGLSRARNAGVAAARGRAIIWTDDDVVVEPQWLTAWLAAFRSHPDIAVFGGRATPLFAEPVAPWFASNRKALRSLLALRDERDWTHIDARRMPYGLSFAVRADVQRRHLYDPALGVAPGRRGGGEEVAVVSAILAEGGRGGWVWDAGVRHVIPAERQTRRYIGRYYRAIGFDHPYYRRDARPVALVRAMLAWARGAVVGRLLWAIGRRQASVRWFVIEAWAHGSVRRHAGHLPPRG